MTSENTSVSATTQETPAANTVQSSGSKAGQVHYRFEKVGDVEVFYREAGDPAAPTLLLLHGFAASSYMWRDVIEALADSYHVVAPDLPAFGFTQSPARGEYEYTFANLTKTIDQFTEQLKLDRYAIAVHDYGAPVGWRLAVTHPSKITAIISQNGNVYKEGLSKGWEPIQTYWNTPSQANREALRDFPTPASIKWQYVEGVSDTSIVAPDAYTLEGAHISQPGMAEIQLDLLLDYATNVEKYPKFQAYFREQQPPLLAVWGKHDPFFLPPGAEAWKRDLPQADIRFYDTGHFALETHGDVIIPVMREFLDKHLKT
jgi:pimeloyl-ACP methyl ester carboxylesterase